MVLKALKDILTIAKRDLIELYRNKIGLAFMFIFPVLMIAIFGFLFPSSSTSFYGVKVGVINLDTAIPVNGTSISLGSGFVSLISKNLTIVNYTSLTSAESDLQAGSISGIVFIPSNFTSSILRQNTATLEIINNPTSPTLEESIDAQLSYNLNIFSAYLINGTISKVDSQLSLILPSSEAKALYINPKFVILPVLPESVNIVSGSYFDFIGPGLIMLLAMMSGLTALGAALSRERETGTLVGVMLTPIKRWALLTGKILSQMVRSLIQAAVIIALAIVLFGMAFHGNIILTAAILILGIFGFLGLGILVTAFTKQQETAQLLLNLVFFPMLFLSGVIYPIQELPSILQDVAHILPLTYGVDAFRQVVVFNAPLSAVYPDLLVLLIFGVVALALAVPVFSRRVRM
jgi:ABC-2 type transport system permease protein